MTDQKVEITLRIPGTWSHPSELVERLPEQFQLTPDHLIMPDSSQVKFSPLPPDEQFAGIFASSCRRPASDDEQQRINNYSANICLTGPGGSLESVMKMMLAGNAILEAGGVGVFIDNSGLSHGATDWLSMGADASVDALTFAFISLIGTKSDVTTLGMHVFGRPEIRMKHRDAENNRIIEVMRYLCTSEKQIDDGHVLIVDQHGPTLNASRLPEEHRFPANSPMFNPWGRFQLVSSKDIAENN